MTKKAFIDERKLCLQFNVGDIVLLPIFTRGNRYAPSMGKVTAVLDKIGFLDVETPFGNLRLSPTEVTKRDITDEDLESTAYDSWERQRAKKREKNSTTKSTRNSAQKVASSFYHKRYANLVLKANTLKDKGFNEVSAYNKLFTHYASSYGEDEIKRAVRIAFIENRTKKALYWKEKGRKYRPTCEEMDTGCFHCPKCHTELQKANYQKRTKLYACPSCLWMITTEDLLNPRDQDDTEDSLENPKTVVDFFTPNDPLLQAVYGKEASMNPHKDSRDVEDDGEGPLPEDESSTRKVQRTPDYFDTGSGLYKTFYEGKYD